MTHSLGRFADNDIGAMPRVLAGRAGTGPVFNQAALTYPTFSLN
jgi:hypothetical protein